MIPNSHLNIVYVRSSFLFLHLCTFSFDDRHRLSSLLASKSTSSAASAHRFMSHWYIFPLSLCTPFSSCFLVFLACFILHSVDFAIFILFYFVIFPFSSPFFFYFCHAWYGMSVGQGLAGFSVITFLLVSTIHLILSFSSRFSGICAP